MYKYSHRRELVAQTGAVVNMYIELAAQSAPPEEKAMAFPSTLRRSMKSISLVPVVSAPVPVDPTCRYNDVRFVSPIYLPLLIVKVQA